MKIQLKVAELRELLRDESLVKKIDEMDRRAAERMESMEQGMVKAMRRIEMVEKRTEK